MCLTDPLISNFPRPKMMKVTKEENNNKFKKQNESIHDHVYFIFRISKLLCPLSANSA